MTTEIALFRRKTGTTILAWARWLSSARLMVLTVVYLLAICGIFAAVLLGEYQDVWAQALRQGGNLSAALRQDIARNVELYDLSLQAVVDGWENPKVRNQDPELRQMILFDRAATAPHLGAILVLDAQGKVVADSAGIAPRQADLAGQDYFKIHAADAHAGLFISKPFIARSVDQWSIGLSRRLNRPDGSFDGVVVGTIELGYLKNLFDRFALGPNDSITLLHEDGAVVMRRPYDSSFIGHHLPSSARIFGDFKTQATGHFIHKSPVDAVERLFVYGQVGHLPLLQIVGISTDDVFAPWLRKALMTAGAVFVLCAAVIALTLLLGVQLRARAAVEEHLTRLAERDPLTSLFNRRRFDEMMEVEWLRALRGRSCLSVLMLDVDCFKLYNDRYGHPVGDTALRAVASCIQASVQRGTDVVGRYGGEEFAILLPASSAEGAAGIAERIRLEIVRLAIAHAGSPHGVITASIGVTSIYPVFGDQPTALIRQADAALYKAKGGGRNRVVCSTMGEAIRAAA
ncbi:diguanylate cyclase [Rhizobiales bacterium GAS191]|nr:diguanylate cyclase [Rhizobiales bacterium GAS113]SEE19657.1 diguanylate cyclase [Rhizobiales bacterium GAS191]